MIVKTAHIDDEEEFRFFFKTLTEHEKGKSRHSLDVTSFNNGEDFLKYFKDNLDEFDMVVLDQSLTGVSGSYVAKKILKMAPDVVVLLCTGNVAKEETLDSIIPKKDLMIGNLLDRYFNIQNTPMRNIFDIYIRGGEYDNRE
jgi:DNA-binding NtrC family response regulator